MDAVTLAAANAAARKALRASRPATVVLWGDSITANSGPTTSGVTVSMNQQGYWTWCARRLGQRLRLVNNAGISGQTSAQILARFATDVAAYSPGYVVILAGRNDGPIGSAATRANLAKMYDLAASIGAVVIACTLPPYNLPNGSTGQQVTDWTTQRLADNDTNSWIKRQQHARSGFYVADFTSAVSDISGNFDFPTTTADGKHPNAGGASRLGRVLFNVLDPIVPRLDVCATTGNDLANYVNINPLMLGTAGTFDANGSGTLATNWKAGIGGTGGAYTVSQVARTDLPGLKWQQLTVSTVGTGGAQVYQYVDTVNAAQLTAVKGDGNLYSAACEFQSDQLSAPVTVVGMSGLALALFAFDASFSRISSGYDMSAGGESYPVESIETSGVMRTPPIPIPAGTVHLQVVVTLAAAGTVRIGRTSVHKVLPVGQ